MTQTETPSTMRALQVTRLSPAFEGCEIVAAPVPRPKAGEALVKVRAAALGFPSLLMTSGGYQFKPELPFIFGGDYAGEVVETGEGASLAPGARVIGGGFTGAFAQYALARAEALTPMPEKASFAEAAAFPSAYLTAHVALAHAGRLQAGEWVLVLGAGGGVGLAAVDLAHWFGARIIAGASSAAKRDAIQAYCPDAHVIDTSVSFKETVREISGGGVDVVYDPVGGGVFADALSSLNFGGRLLVIGFASGEIPTLSVNRALIKHVSVIGVRAGEFSRRFPERRAETMRAIFEGWSQGALHPRVDKIFALDDWRAAMERMTSRSLIGRVIVRPE
jgi:NADPH2:quinone reductase